MVSIEITQANVEAAWPSEDVESRAKRAAAMFLLLQPECTSTSSTVAMAVLRSLGRSLNQSGVRKPLRRVLEDSSTCFKCRSAWPGELYITLDPSAVVQQQQQQQGQQLPGQQHVVRAVVRPAAQHQNLQHPNQQQLATRPAVAAAAASNASIPLQQVQCPSPSLWLFINSRVWHSNPQLNVVRKALALHLVKQANQLRVSTVPNMVVSDHIITSPEAGQVMVKAWNEHFKGQTRCYKKIKQALAGDPYFSILMTGQNVQLDIAQLLQDAASHQAQNGNNAASSSNSSSSSTVAMREHQQICLDSTAKPVSGPQIASPAAIAAANGPSSSPSAAAAVAFQAAVTAVMSRQTKERNSRDNVSSPPLLPLPPPPPPSQQRQQEQQQDAPQRLVKQQQQEGPYQEPFQAVPMMQLHEGLQALNQVTADNCAAAEVLLVAEGTLQHSHLQQMLRHVAAAKLVALDLEFAQVQMTNTVGAAPVSSRSNSSTGGNRQHRLPQAANTYELALLQLFVPTVDAGDPATAVAGGVASVSCNSKTVNGQQQQPIWAAAVYLIEVPQQQDAASQLMLQMQPMFESPTVIKIVHDGRNDSVVLQDQFGISLRTVLDTQLLAGVVALGAAGQVIGNSGNSTGNGSHWDGHLGRVGLGNLYKTFGYPHPHKASMCKLFNQNPRLWFQRPLPAQAAAYAADDVRYLLPLLHSLLQQVPQALLCLSGLQLLLAQKGANVLQLQQQLVPGYIPLLEQQQQQWQDSIPSNSTKMSAAQQVVMPRLTQLQFELKLKSTVGWYQPSYVVYLNDEHAGEFPETGSAAGAVLMGVTGNSAQLTAAQINNPAVQAGGALSAEFGAEGGQIDEAVQSMIELLPCSLKADLKPFLSAKSEPQLMELQIDKHKPVVLKLSDRTSRQLSYSISMQQALHQLKAAWQQREPPQVQNEDHVVTTGVADGEGSSSPPGDIVSNGTASTHLNSTAAAAAAAGSINMFGTDHRMGVPGTLHRISAMRDRQNRIYGLTYRIGRHIPGVATLLADVLSSMKASLATGRPRSLLVLGRPGVGKTTLLRDIARIMSLPFEQGGLGLGVVLVDTSNEIAGDSEVCHPCIGSARRMMVRTREQQAVVLVQAVQNHTPDVIIVDEIGTAKEVAAARTISQRGVLLVGTAHGMTLSDLLTNPELKPLVGGVSEVTLGDIEAKASNRGHKTRLERAGAAPFLTLLELQSRDSWRLHLDVEQSVDLLLAAPPDTAAGMSLSSSNTQQQRQQLNTQLRTRVGSKRLMVQFETPVAARQALQAAAAVAAAAMDSANAASASASGVGCARAFSGGWLVDLMHAAVHKSIEASAHR